MRKILMGTAAVVVLGAVAIGGWLATRDQATDAPPIAATETVPTDQSAATAESATTAAPDAATESAPAEQVAAAPTGDQPGLQADDRVLGSPDAPVTIIEYASMTCPHCANFHKDTLPHLKSEYIDKGQVRLVFRDFPLDQVALRASMLARCMPEERYFNMIDVLFRTQPEWARAQDPVAALGQLARTAGLSQEEFDRCMADETAMNQILAGLQTAQSEFDIRSTPSFIVNGEKHAGALSSEELDRILEEELSDS